MEACIQKHTRERVFFFFARFITGSIGGQKRTISIFLWLTVGIRKSLIFHTLSSFQIYWSRKAIRETFWQKEKKKTKKKKKLLCCRVSAVVTAVIMKYEKYAQEQGVAKWTRQKRAILDLSHFREEKKSIIDHMHKDWSHSLVRACSIRHSQKDSERVGHGANDNLDYIERVRFWRQFYRFRLDKYTFFLTGQRKRLNC